MVRLFIDRLERLIVIGILSFVTGCSVKLKSCPHDTLEWSESRLFFGRDIGDEGEVTPQQWRDFAAAEIIPRFGDGFTVLGGTGYWKGASCKAVLVDGGCEKSKILLVQYPPSPEADAKLKAIANAYIEQFEQEAVMRSDTPVCTQFYSGN